MKLRELLEKLIPITIVRRSTLRKKDEELKELRQKLKLISRGPEGIRTLQRSELYTIFDYLDRLNKGESGLESRAQEHLDQYFEAYLQQKESRVYEYEGNTTKAVYLPDPDIQEGVLRKTWLIKKCDNEERAKLENLVDLSNRPNKARIGRYFFEEEVMGPDLFELFLVLNERINAGDKFAFQLKYALINKTLQDLAYFQTHPPEVPSDLVEESSCEIKLPQTFAQHTSINSKLETILASIGRRLDGTAEVFFRDAGLWNTRVSYKGVLQELNKTHLFDEQIENYRNRSLNDQNFIAAILTQLEAGSLSINDVVNAYVINVYQIDFATVNRRTFQSDDVIHIVESPVSNLSIEKVREKERLFLGEVTANEEQTDSYYRDRELKSFYRHVRLWSLYAQGKIQNKYSDNQDFHLFQAYTALHRHLDKPIQGLTEPEGLEPLIDLLDKAI